MTDRKQTPDIMGDLLGEGEKPAPKAEEQNDSIPVSQQAGKTVKRQARKPVRQPDSKPVEQETSEAEKIKATYYLSPEAIDSLDQGWLQLRKLAKAGDKAGISKSLIIEQALLLATDELEAKGAKSKIASKTVRQ
jgi:hypothetical protein